MADTTTGWIKLYRSFTKWEWYTEPSVMRLYLHLMLTANIEEKKWKGITVKRGQTVTSLNHLAGELQLDKHTISNALKKLKSTGEISTVPTAKFSIITLNNFDRFQDNPTKDHRSPTSSSPQPHPTKEYKNNKNEKEDTPPADSSCEKSGGWKAREGHDF